MVEVTEKEITQVLLFGDQTVDKLPAIRSLVSHARESSLLKNFLRNACDIVQIEVSRLRPYERRNIDDFDSLLALAEDNSKRQDPNEIVATVLMGIARLGELIWHAEHDNSILGSTQHTTHILGLCTGEIVAAIPAAAQSLPELYNLSVEAVGIFCRFARDIIRRSMLVDSTNDSWATTIVGIHVTAVQSILDKFHVVEKIPSARQIAVGFIAQGWVTLFGPPTTTRKLLQWSKVLNEAPRVPTDARGGVHMPQLPELNENEIVGTSSLLEKTLPSTAVIWSPYNCQQRKALTLKQLLVEIIRDVTQKPLMLHDVISALGEHLSSCQGVNLVAAGYTPHLPVIQRAFLSRGINCTIAENEEHQENAFQSSRGGTGKFAIVGVSGRFPGSESVAEYWQSLLDAERFIREIPNERFDLEKWFDPTGKQKNATVNRSGAFLDRPGAFDHRLFNMSPREAFQADPLHRLFLTVCYEALETSGYSPDATPSTQSNRIATYFGQTSDDWRDLLLTKGVDIYYAPGICRAFGPSRVNYHFKWGGPSYGIDSACASSVTAISLACSALASRECDTALAGGGSILNSPAPFAGLSRGGFLSPEKGCETYHDEADGYVRGEGVGVVILKRLEDAIAENDNILGVITGAARNYSSDASSISHPSPDAQQRLYRQVLHQSGTDPSSIGYVEMHGTGTQAGDAAEMSSVLGTFAGSRSRDNPLVVGAVKANIGHGEAAAGVCALIKAVMMLGGGQIPPQPDMPFQINRRFPDLARMNVHIASNGMTFGPSPNGDGKKRIFLNSFDASGGNSCLLLEEPPKATLKEQDPRSHHVVTFSARTPKSLEGIMGRYLHHIKTHPEISLADLAYSTTARRMHSTLRKVFVAKSLIELEEKLEATVKDTTAPPSKKAGLNSVVFAFTGQGSQYAGMGHQLWKHSPEFRRLINSYQEIVLSLGLPSFQDLIEQENLDLSSVSTVPIQLAIVALEIAIANLWISWGIQPSMVIGHSLGEYAALCIAGVLTVGDTFALVGRRAQMLAESIPENQAAMLAIGKSAEEVKVILSSSAPACEIACLNAPQSTVVSGSLADLEQLQETLCGNGIRISLLRVPYAFHSAQLEPILDSFESAVGGVNYSPPTFPVASTLLGRVVHPGEANVFSPSYFRRQAREPVNFVGALEASQEATIVRPGTIFIEVGPEPVCLGLVRANLAATVKDLQLLPTLRSGDDNWGTIANSLGALYAAGQTINWTEHHRDFIGCLSLLDLPTYCFDEKEFWEPYPDPEAANTSLPASKPAITPTLKDFSTTTLQRVEKEIVNQDSISVTFQSNTAEPHLLAAIQAHAVAGVKICSSSIFSDMALSAARYARERLQPGSSDAVITIRALDIRHAIVVMDPNPSQIIEIEAKHNKGASSVQVYFRTKTDDSPLEEIGICEIDYTRTDADLSWKNDLSRRKLLIDSRIEALQLASRSGKAHRMLRPVIYQLFSGLVEYGKGFQGLDELVMDEKFRDAVGKVQLPTLPDQGNFLYSPYLLDAVVHLVGFLANCGLKYPAEIAFLSTGFDAWHLLKPLSSTATYTSYAYLEESSDGALLVGDVYVLEGAELVSVLSGLRFQKMKKTVLSRILLSAAPTATRKNTRFASQSVPDPDDGLISGMTTGPSTSRVTSPPTSGVSTPGTSVDEGPALFETLLKIVSEEAGVDLSELQPDTSLNDLGVDSLMTITIIASLRNETGLELSGSFFLDNSTVAEVEKALGADDRARTPESPKTPETKAVEFDPPTVAPIDVPAEPIARTQPADHPDLPAARALLLQGSAPIVDKLPLFALPDGSGSVSAYVQLPPLSASRRLYGLESPFVRQDATPLTELSVEAMAASFVRSIREIQPEGPYLLIGCSTGATYAYEVARILLESGQVVEELLLGGPAPVTASDELKSIAIGVQQVDQSGLLGSSLRGGPQAVQHKSHLAASLQLLTKYEVKSLSDGKLPSHVTLLVPTKGLNSRTSEASIKGSEFLSWVNANWTHSEGLGWSELFQGAEVRELDSDYFSMMRYPQVETLGITIDHAVSRSG